MVSIIILLFILGLSFGSFLNAFEWRIKNRVSLLKGRSICPHCNREIRWYDNIPLISFFLLKRKCRNCKKNISWQYPVVELWMGIVFVALWFVHLHDNTSVYLLVRDLFAVWILTFIFMYDLKYLEVVDFAVLPAVPVVFVLALFARALSWENMLIGMALGMGFFLLQYVVSKGKWIGGGDIRIGLLMGVILGWKLLIMALWVAYIIGAIVAVGLLITKKKGMKSEVPMGTFLTVATLVTMIVGDQLIGWYIALIK